MSNELGWNGLFDEGVRLLAKSNVYSGIRVTLQTPGEYDCSSAESYFNFYLGFNEKPGSNPGRQIEAGISYSAKGWQSFINNGGSETASQKISVGNGAQIMLELSLSKQNLRLSVAGSVLSDSFPLSSAAPKMIVALHESHQDLKNRKVWFDKVLMNCTHVKIGEKWELSSAAKLTFDFTHIDKKLMMATPMNTSLNVTMNKPA
jgi:hypothetical protein